MKLDETKLADALRSIHGTLTHEETHAIVDVARLAASADGRMDLNEMGAIARISKVLYAMAGEDNPPVPAQLPDKSKLGELGKQLGSTGARELAYACAMLVMQTDLKVTKDEAALGAQLVGILGIDEARATALAAQMDALVRDA